MVLLGSPWNDIKKTTWDQPGTAQASSLTFYGSWSYNKSEITDDVNADGTEDWYPVNSGPPWFEFKAYLDGGHDEPSGGPHEGDRCFIPRYPASYQFVINGTISYTTRDPQHAPTDGGPYGIGWHEVISFTYKGYISVQPDGSGKYGGILTDVMSTDPEHNMGTYRPLELFDPGHLAGPPSPAGLTGSDFSIAFCPEWNIENGIPTTPLNAYKDNLGDPGFKADGRWPQPHAPWGNATGPKAWPPQFSLYVVNNTGNSTVVPLSTHANMYANANGTGRELIGESLMARADVVENLLFLGKYAQEVIG